MRYLEARAVDQRMRLVTAIEAGEETITALCRRFDLSRKARYRWLGRYRSAGIAGLADRPQAPQRHPQAIEAATLEQCLAVHRERS